MRYGYYSYEAEQVDVIGNEYRDNIVYGIDPHDRSRHLVIALNTAYGTHKKHGIIVSREVNDSFIIGNISVKNNGSGIMLDRMSLRNLVYANTAVDNEGDGLSFYESGCNIAVANNISGNRRAGIKVRNSADVGLFDNTIRANADSGADIYASDLMKSPEGQSRNFVLDPFEPLATTILAENEFVGNGLGINASGATSIVLDRNRFSNQRNQVFSGELRELSSFLLQIGQRSSVSVENLCQTGAPCAVPARTATGTASTEPSKAKQMPALACIATSEGTEARAEAEGKTDG
jgi:poly(beta-D-mannuronate) C5 epimerase